MSKTEQPIQPPQWIDQLLERFCAPDLLEEVLGDLHERFYLKAQKVGAAKARKTYWREVLAYVRPVVFRHQTKYKTKTTSADMIRNYLKVAFRHLLHKKTFSTINILGLALGMACCLLIFQYVHFEYSFDTFNKNFSNLHRVIWATVRAGEEPVTWSRTAWALGPALAQEVPEVEYFVRLHPEYNNAIVSNPAQPDKAFEEEGVYYADSSFFKMFTYPLIAGNPEHALAPGTILISESAAQKYFGDEDPMGKVLDVNGWISGNYRVDGIFKDVPAHSHLQFDMLLPMADLLRTSQYKEASSAWSWFNFITYVQLRSGANRAAVEQKFSAILTRNREEDWKEAQKTGYVTAQPLADVHLNADIVAPKTVMGSYQAVYLFSIIGAIVLLIGLVNYINLSTARAVNRAAEVGIRKVSGANRTQLIIQFLTESAITIIIAFALALALADVSRPFINNLTGLNLNNALWKSQEFWFIFFSVAGVSTLLSGLYPAFVLSSFKPIAALKGKAGGTILSRRLRQGLVVLQFTASIVLLVGATTIYSQLNYVQHMDLGINLEQVLVVPAPRVLPEGTKSENAVETFSQEAGKLPAVLQTATSYKVPGKGFAFWASNLRNEETAASAQIPAVGTYIDSSFASVYDLKLVTGEGFKNMSATQKKGEPEPVIANETAIHALGFALPEQAIGQYIELKDKKGQVVGVFKDFNWSSAHEEREAALFFLNRGNSYISIKVSGNNLPQTVASIEKLYGRLFPGNPFLYSFADETFQAQYQSDQRFAGLLGVFTTMAMFIASLGLFGLVAFTTQQRRKEIGIRKVLGASVNGIVMLLSGDFLKLIAVAFGIAIPIAWLAMQQWLQDFAYRIELGWWIFALAGTLAVLIAFLTVSFQAIKAAIANPVDSLKNE